MTYQETAYQKFIPVDPSGNVIGADGGGGSDATATNQTTQIELETEIRDRLPSALVSGRLPVDVQSLTVNVNNAQLEISNEIGNPIPISDSGVPITGSAIPTGGSGIIGWLSASWKLIGDIRDRLPSALVGDRIKVDGSGSVQPVAGITRGVTEASQFYTRPSDTVAYAVSDALSNSVSAPSALTFINVARIIGGTGYIVTAVCYTNQITMLGAIRLHLFKRSASPTATNDNSPYALYSGDNPMRIGYIDFSNFTTGGSGSDTAMAIAVFPQGRLIPFTCDASNSNIYGLVEVRAAFTPVSGQIFNFYLGIEQN